MKDKRGDDIMKRLFVVFLLVVLCLSANLALAVEVSITEGLASKYVTKSGSIASDTLVNQGSIILELGNWYTSVWYNHEFQSKQITEHDLVIGRRFALGNYVGGNISADITTQLWTFNDSGTKEYVLQGILKYKGSIDISLVWSKFVTDQVTADRNRWFSKISRSFTFDRLSLTPLIRVAYLNNFGGEGLAHVGGGISGSYQLLRNTNLTMYVKCQEGIIESKKDFCWGGSGIKMTF